jgi:threonyl-tRNA synthetase
LYTNGPFTDLCRGPHAPTTKSIGAFKLMSVAGAYWRGDSKRTMLTRIYGTAFFSKAQLEEYLELIERAKERDHRKLGKELGLFMFSESRPAVRSGSRLARRSGTRWRSWRDGTWQRGYMEVKTPQIYDAELWKHLRPLGQVPREHVHFTRSRGGEMGVKPMNCPGHVHLYGSQRHSYRDLPVRYAEPGCCTATSPPARSTACCVCAHFAQDDGHIFCTEEQVEDEVQALPGDGFATYALFGFEPRLELSTRPEKRIGTDEMWDHAEARCSGARAQRAPVRAWPGRRRLLRPQDRHAHDRLAGALLAAGHGAARLLDARALRSGATPARTTPSTAR